MYPLVGPAIGAKDDLLQDYYFDFASFLPEVRDGPDAAAEASRDIRMLMSKIPGDPPTTAGHLGTHRHRSRLRSIGCRTPPVPSGA
jgi:hypothetical protein